MFALVDQTEISPVQKRLEAMVESEAGGRLGPALKQVVPQLAALLVATRRQPLPEVRRMVARVLHEHCEVDEGGDAPMRDEKETEMHVDLVMRAADAWRQEAEYGL